MTSAMRLSLAPPLLASALLAAGLFAPAPAAAEPAARAVAQCRAAMLSHFPEGAVRTYRVAEISGSSRRPRVAFYVTADKRYRFECAADPDGNVVTAAFDPPRRDSQLASGR